MKPPLISGEPLLVEATSGRKHARASLSLSGRRAALAKTPHAPPVFLAIFAFFPAFHWAITRFSTMRPRHVLAILLPTIHAHGASFAAIDGASTNASSTITLPLEWVDRLAYVATVTLDGAPTRLALSTMVPYVWVACGLQPPSPSSTTCQPDRCDVSIDAETNRHCATQRSASLSLGSSTSSTATMDVTLRIAQYHNLTQVNDTKIYALPAMRPDYTAEQPRLVTGAVGVLGLGRDGSAGLETVSREIRSFSLFVTSDPQGSQLVLDVGTPNSSDTVAPLQLQLGDKWSANITVPLRNASGEREDDRVASADRWELSLLGVQFGDTAFYPRKYTWADTVGADAAATLSLNHAVIQMPVEVLKRFRTTYLSTCSTVRNAMGNRAQSCPATAMTSLPPITFYLGAHAFVLEPEDYTHTPTSNASAIIVEIDASEDSSRWVLGAPFLRKFAARFGVISKDVTLFCQYSVSCRPQSRDAIDFAFVADPPSWLTPISPPTVPTDGKRTPSSSSDEIPTRTQSPMLLAAIWVGRSLAVLILLVTLLRTVAMCRDRILGRRRGGGATGSSIGADETCTIASERDIEENKAELRAMAAAEEAAARRQRSRAGTTAVEDDRAAEYARLESPRPQHTRG
jgi:hypothetical protein